MEVSRTAFLADLTTSEGRLHRFTAISRIIAPRAAISSDRLRSLIQEEVKLTNTKVIRRHIRAMQSLGLIERSDIGYILSSEGKALCELTTPNLASEPELAEKVFYLRALAFHLPVQFTSMLLAIFENVDKSKERVISSYGQKVLPTSTWTDKTKTDLRTTLLGQPDLPPRKVQNNFDCFRLWLRQLELVRPDPLRLTRTGQMMVEIAAQQASEIRDKIYWVAAAYMGGAPPQLPRFNYDDDSDRQLFLKLLHRGYERFERPELRLSDVRSISVYVCIVMLVEGHRILDEASFWQLVNQLLRDRRIGSILAGRDGKAAYITLG